MINLIDTLTRMDVRNTYPCSISSTFSTAEPEPGSEFSFFLTKYQNGLPPAKYFWMCLTLFFFLPLWHARSQATVGQQVPDVTEVNCQGVPERIYDVLAGGKPVLVFKTDMICSNTTTWGTTIRQFANLHASTYRTWVCADFEEANTSSEQCTYMQQYEQQTGLNTNSVFRFIDETSEGPYDPNARKGLDQILCYQGYIVIGLDSTIKYVGNSMMGAVNSALAAAQITQVSSPERLMDFIIYPNPVQDVLRWEESNEVQQVIIFDHQGRHVLNKTIHHETAINVSDLKMGNYLARIQLRNGAFTSKIFSKN
jgi:hypothetical protein